MSTADRAPSPRLLWSLAVLAAVGTGLWCAGQTGGLGPSRAPEFLRVMAVAIWLPALWMLAAVGWGRLTMRALGTPCADPTERAALTLGLGVCAQLIAVAWCAWLGIIPWQRPIGAGLPLVIGLVGLAGAPRRVRLTPPSVALLLALAIPVGVMMAGAASAPGWLWQTEFGGYDALSYHLLLPREWIDAGRMATLEHNVYSALPSFVEASFMQLIAFAPDARGAGTWAQSLHALMACAAALTCAGAARRVARACGATEVGIDAAGWCAAIALLATPWIIATSTLAYTEMPLVIAMALAVLLLVPSASADAPAQRDSPQTTTDHAQRWPALVYALALVGAAAVGAKGSAAGFVVLPAGLIVLVAGARALRRWWWHALAACFLAALALAPWWLRNWMDAGQPFFPFVRSLGPGQWWTAAQQDAFAAAHAAPKGTSLAPVWNEWLRFGMGAAPAPGEPWRPQWMLLPWLGLGGVAALLVRRDRGDRRGGFVLATMILVGLAFWLGWTHQKSRFLVPLAAPLAIAAGALLSMIRTPWRAAETGHARRAGRMRHAITNALLLGMGCAVPWWFATDGRQAAPAAAIGAEDTFTGSALAQLLRAQKATDDQWLAVAGDASPAFVLNELLAPDARVYSLGDSRCWYMRAIPSYHSVWDRGPLERLLIDGATGEACVEALRAGGYSHLLVDLGMLQRWRSSGWLDARMTEDRVDEVMRGLEPVARTAGACVVLRIPPAPRP